MSSDNSQINFNPSWMQPTLVKNDKINGILFEDEELIDPVFANNRYGREDLLALLVKDAMPPDGLSRCSFFVEKAQMPIILQPLNETELRLQQNINSSKALSAINRQDRNIINGNDPSSVNSSSKWNTSGGTRNFYSHNKPASHRWNSFNNSTNNGNESSSFRNVKSSGHSFKSTGTNLRLNNEQRSNRFRISNTTNETTITTSTSFDTSPSTSNTTGTSNFWTKIKKNQDLNDAKFLTEENALLFTTDQENNLTSKITPKTESPIQNFSEQKEYFDASVSSLTKESNELALSTKSVKNKIIKWYYLDPKNVQRGPFESKQMQTWYSYGYFTNNLKICKSGEKNFITLGDLIQINGSNTPFYFKSDLSISESGDEIKFLDKNVSDNINFQDVNNVNDNNENNHWKNISGVSVNSNISSIDNFLTDVNNVNNLPNVSKIDLDLQKFFIQKQKLIEEEQNKLREKKELLEREEQERLEKERLIYEKELELQRKQDELQRIARETEEELELRRQQVAEFERQKREALEEMEERLRNEQLKQKEEERLRLEAEIQRKLEAEEKRKLEAERIKLKNEKKRKQEEEANIKAAYEEARRLQELSAALKAEKEQRERLLLEKEKLKLETEKAEAKKKQILKKNEAAEKKRKAEEKQQKQEQEMLHSKQMEEELNQKNIQANLYEFSSPTKNKPAPWVTVSSKIYGKNDKLNLKEEHTGKTLVEIQQEEEEALREKLKQQQKILESNNHQTAQALKPWSSKLSGSKNGIWDKPTNNLYSSLSEESNSNKQAVTTVETSTTRSWKQVQNQKPIPIPKSPIKNNTQQKNKKSNSTQKISSKNLTEKSKPDAFTFWIIKRIRELSTSVDAEVFASFIEGVESPNEAEDYLIGYLGESKAVKDFHREFLNKRIELRPRLVPTKEDDLSGPAAAATDTHSNLSTTITQPTTAINKKKKKVKHQQVLDLGFKPTGDPNRFNAGEIDTAPPVSTNRKR